VTGGGASDGDMPTFPWPAHSDVPPVGDAAFDALLAGELLPGDAAGALRPVAEAVAALSGPPLASELAGEASALAVFRGAIARSREPARAGRRRHPVPARRLSARIAAAAAAAAVALSGAAAAAYADVLPAPAQNLAHDIIGAPRVRPAVPAVPAAPTAAARHAAYGLCTAYAHLSTHGSAGQKAAVFRKLAAAAGGAANVPAYCAAAARPSATPADKAAGQPAGHPGGKSASHPAGNGVSHPGGRPTSHPGGKPTSHPAGEPTGHPGGGPTNTP
jgi:hypothetical protein